MSSFVGNGKVYILGAGASVFAGYPLAASLLQFIRNFQGRDQISGDIAARVRNKLNDAEFFFCKHVVRNPNGTANLEDLLTYLDLYRSFPGTNFALNPWETSDSDDVRHLVTEKFLYYQCDLHTAAWGATSPVEPVSIDVNEFRNVCDAWASRIKPGDTVLTFNWDILHEVLLWRTGSWSYRDGYGFECGEQGVNEPESGVLLLKLHGSVNWVQEDEDEVITEIANVSDFFVDSEDCNARPRWRQAQPDSGQKLILPTYLKDISSNKALLEIWTKAHDIISRATEVVVIGYSLNRADHPARLLFGTALSKNRSLSEVTVVAPDTTEWDKFLFHIGKGLKCIPLRFEQWVRE